MWSIGNLKMKTMYLKITGSSSSGNNYILDSGSEILLIESGVTLKKVKESIDFDLSKVIGCICSHYHSDHFKFAPDYMKAGIDMYSSKETLELSGIDHHRAHIMEPKKTYQIGSFRVMGFMMPHGDIESMGFIIKHGSNKILFVTDCHYVPYKFSGLTNLLIEANHDIEIVDHKLLEGNGNVFVRDRSLSAHMELQTAKAFLKANDLSAVNNIVLIHLSDSGSDEKRFVKEIAAQTGKTTYAAKAGLEIDFGITPF